VYRRDDTTPPLAEAQTALGKQKQIVLWNARRPICLKNCFSGKISLKSGNRLLSYSQKTYFKYGGRPASCIEKKHIWLHHCHRVTNVLLCNKFHQNWMTLRLYMAI